MPWARCLESMRTGEGDLITGLAYTQQRAAHIRYSVLSYYTVSPAFYTISGQGHLIREYKDLYRYNIGHSHGSAYFEPFNSDQRLSKTGVPTEDLLLRMLLQGHLDVIIGTDANVSYDLARKGLKGRIEKVAYTPVSLTELFMGISRKSAFMSRADELDRVLGILVRTGVIDRLAERHF